ncbi:accessory gene regulator B family protein [Brevibacillus choshinensis]|uniref:accessory gene regulator ArgB-like protein n=1 Tax=Brevibacillus choshinensis TaxID=54911 RepID=UPI002E246E40|nr:accessory gene regulator B family protein [Brevibacillus choshinensis]
MTWTEKVSMRLAKRLKTEDTTYSVGQLAHGIEIFMLNIINGLALIIISAIFQIFGEVMLLCCLFFLHRLLTGGVHLRNPWTCLLATLSLMIAGGYLLKHLPVLPAPYSQLLVLVGVGLSIAINYRHAPAAHTYAPTNPAIQRRNRFIVLWMLVVGCAISISLVGYTYQYSMAYTLAVLLQSVLLMPSSFRLVSRLEKTFLRG